MANFVLEQIINNHILDDTINLVKIDSKSSFITTKKEDYIGTLTKLTDFEYLNEISNESSINSFDKYLLKIFRVYLTLKYLDVSLLVKI